MSNAFKELEKRLQYKEGEKFKVLKDTIELTDKYQRTFGVLKNVKDWKQYDLKEYMDKYEFSKKQAYDNINVIRDLQDKKMLYLPFYNAERFKLK